MADKNPDKPEHGSAPDAGKKEKKEKKDKAAADKAAEGEKAAPKAKAPRERKPLVHIVSRLADKYNKEIVSKLGEKFKRTNKLSLPRLKKIVVNMGVGKALQDKNRLEQSVEQLGQITGQKPQITIAKKAISGFRLREGNQIGCRVTLRGQRMYEFLDRLISVALPRIRDFRGVNPKSFDGNGNYTLGLTEQAIFPEIDPDKITFTQGMDVTFVMSAGNDDESRELLRQFGMPFRES